MSVAAHRKHWGWGLAEYPLKPGGVDRFELLLGVKPDERVHFPAPELEEINLQAPRFDLPPELSNFCSSEKKHRVRHAYGCSFRDVLRVLAKKFDAAPDYVAFPSTEQQIMELMRFCGKNAVALVPVGGGSSVVGGIEPCVNPGSGGSNGDACLGPYRGFISLNMEKFDKVLKVDKTSRTVHVQCGIFGPALETQLRPHGYTLRHFPQSFEFSTLGGWIATRAGGHYATRFTHIDDFVESVRIVTPTGVVETPRLPASGAGPDGARIFIGSEGTLGVITSAWMRVQERPKYRASTVVRFKNFLDGAEAVRRISQSGATPSNCRLIDALEAFGMGLSDGSYAALILAFESAHIRDFSSTMEALLEMCKECRGAWDPIQTKQGDKTVSRDTSSTAINADPATAWRNNFIEAPYVRDVNVQHGFITETFETCCTWDRWPKFYKGVREAVLEAIKSSCDAPGHVTCRFTHVYPDGPAPYFTIFARGSGSLMERVVQWDSIKKAASDAVIELGGTITHHHAVGRDHTPHYQREVDSTFLQALVQVKRRLDPHWIMNPGVLLDVPADVSKRAAL